MDELVEQLTNLMEIVGELAVAVVRVQETLWRLLGPDDIPKREEIAVPQG